MHEIVKYFLHLYDFARTLWQLLLARANPNAKWLNRKMFTFGHSNMIEISSISSISTFQQSEKYFNSTHFVIYKIICLPLCNCWVCSIYFIIIMVVQIDCIMLLWWKYFTIILLLSIPLPPSMQWENIWICEWMLVKLCCISC